MAVIAARDMFRSDIVDRLREMAAQGADLAEMVAYVQRELGFSEAFIVPVLGYFCRAFALPLSEVLPLRKWWETRDDEEVAVLVGQIRNCSIGQHS
jgi:hypothetical protein